MVFFGGLCFAAWSLANASDSKGEHDAIRAYFALCTYAFGDIMDHALITRVGQIPFPSLQWTRGLWVVGAFCAVSLVTPDPTFKWLTVGCMMALHTQYFWMMKRTICKCLKI